MAEVSFLHFPEDDHDLLLEEFCGPICDFDLADDLCIEIGNENAVVSSSERKNQVNFVMDLFHQRVEESNLMGTDEVVSNDINDSTFGVIEENCYVGRHPLVLESGLGLGLVDEENGNHDNDDGGDYYFRGFVVSDCGEDFCIARRSENVSVNCDESSSRVSGLGLVDEEHDNHVNGGGGDYYFRGVVSDCWEDFCIARRSENVSVNCGEGSSRVSGLRAVWIESDLDVEVEEGIDNVLLGVNVNSDEEGDFGVDNVNDDGDLSVALCWDSFHLEEDDNVEVNHDFEWEEVDDEREVSSFVADPEDEEGSISVLNISGPEEDGERGSRVSNLEWEVLLNHMNVNNLYRNPEMENEAGVYFGDHDDHFYTAEYEMMFGQFVEGENALGRPPASKTVVEKLSSVVIAEVDVVDEKSLCAVCKDHIEVGEEGKKLPCSHLYHGDCIIPWLRIRNTCPVCRFELPTDDPDYEQRRTGRSTRVA